MERMKPKKCKVCRESFEPFRPLQSCCSTGCAIQHANKLRAKKELKEASEQRKEHRKAKEAIKTRAQWMHEAQAAFNKFIRLRDADKNCISSDVGNVTYYSGMPKQTSWDAGHYRSIGACPELRFNELNVHKQSVHDNQHLHGNLIKYRVGLIKRIGLENVEWLEGHHEPKKYTIESLKEIKATYTKKAKELTK